jgi:hypothetical protein
LQLITCRKKIQEYKEKGKENGKKAEEGSSSSQTNPQKYFSIFQ